MWDFEEIFDIVEFGFEDYREVFVEWEDYDEQIFVVLKKDYLVQ